MAELTAEEMDLTGLSATYNSAAGGGDSFQNDGNTFLHVKNGDTGGHTVTVAVQKTITIGGVTLSISDPSVTITADGDQFIGPFDRDWFNDNNKLVQISYDAVTSVTVAVMKI